MLADEQALRDQLDGLMKRVAKLPAQVEYDKRIGLLVDEFQPIPAAFKQAADETLEHVLRVMWARATEVHREFGTYPCEEREECGAAQSAMERLQSLYEQAAGISESIVELVVARAELGVVPVDRHALAAMIDDMAAKIEIMERAVQSRQDLFDRECGAAAAPSTDTESN